MELVFTKVGSIATVRLNRPESLNALTPSLCNDLLNALKEVRADEEIKCMIITGTGKGFCSGADVKRRVDIRESHGEAGPATRLVRNRRSVTMPTVIPFFRQVEKPIIAAVNGVAAAAGFSLALACDVRIASEDARFKTAFIDRGLVPASGQSYFLTRAVGLGKALELMFSGGSISAEDALKLGLVNKVVPRDELTKESMDMAEKFARHAPLAMAFTKLLAYRALENDLVAQIDLEMQLMAMCRDTADHREGDKAFLENREALFTGG